MLFLINAIVVAPKEKSPGRRSAGASVCHRELRNVRNLGIEPGRRLVQAGHLQGTPPSRLLERVGPAEPDAVEPALAAGLLGVPLELPAMVSVLAGGVEGGPRGVPHAEYRVEVVLEPRVQVREHPV